MEGHDIEGGSYVPFYPLWRRLFFFLPYCLVCFMFTISVVKLPAFKGWFFSGLPSMDSRQIAGTTIFAPYLHALASEM